MRPRLLLLVLAFLLACLALPAALLWQPAAGPGIARETPSRDLPRLEVFRPPA
ncbi:hypothetical protein SH611_20960 [Geminicoccaceae bacterium 1502E]|nr:hypothetical protein [Geminicoccaceae bacterium 1502E]